VSTLAGETDAAEAVTTLDAAPPVVPLPASATAVSEPVDAGSSDSEDAATAADDAAVATSETDAGKLPPFTGLLDFPPAAEGHRVYVDGKMVGVPPQPILVGCGPRVVRIGSAGKDRDVIVPCGGHLALTYP
jgi:hypothetical protein